MLFRSDMGARFVQNKPNFKVLNLDDIIIMGNNAQQRELSKANEPIKEPAINQHKERTGMGRRIDI